MIEVRHLRAFQAVAEELSFVRAAERLSLAQPALSRTIKDLEVQMSVQLFERSTRTVTITAAGKLFQNSVNELFASLATAISQAQQAQKGVAGELRVGYNDFAMNGLLPMIVRRFRSEYPMVSVWLGQVPSPEMVRHIEQGKLDAAFHMGPAVASSVESILVRDEQLLVVVPDSHPLANKKTIRPIELANEKFVMGRRDTWRQFHQVIVGFCRAAGFDIDIVQESLNSDGIIGLVAAGLGVTLYVDSDWLYTTRGISAVPLDRAGPRIETLLSWRRGGNQQSPTLQHFLRIAGEVISEEGVNRRQGAGLSPT